MLTISTFDYQPVSPQTYLLFAYSLSLSIEGFRCFLTGFCEHLVQIEAKDTKGINW